jgi:hypothetical protein
MQQVINLRDNRYVEVRHDARLVIRMTPHSSPSESREREAANTQGPNRPARYS